jgi:hypothetical protein
MNILIIGSKGFIGCHIKTFFQFYCYTVKISSIKLFQYLKLEILNKKMKIKYKLNNQ